jgi:hypothetical protein
MAKICRIKTCRTFSGPCIHDKVIVIFTTIAAILAIVLVYVKGAQ